MALKASKKDYWFNFVYSMGAAVVIIGALFKITHMTLGPLSGNILLGIGLLTEALIFVISAFDAPGADYAWEKAYPELLDAEPVAKKAKAVVATQGELPENLTAKFDKLLADAKLDSALFERLRTGIDNFGSAVQEINKTSNAVAATQKYGSELESAATKMESLNKLYQTQLDSSSKLAENLTANAETTEAYQKQLATLTENVNNLNKVYGGMLSAMKIS